MTTHVSTLPKILEKTNQKGLYWKLALTHPVLAFLLIAFGWSWLFWLSGVPLQDHSPVLVMALTLIGGYGPALAGILTLGLKNGLTFDMPRGRLVLMAIFSALIFGLMVLEYRAGKTLGYGTVPQETVLTLPLVVAALLASLTGGWVISSARSSLAAVRERMASLLPSRAKGPWILFALLFYPVMILVSWLISTLFGIQIEYPALWGRSALEILPLFLLTSSLTALARGGMEEPGWRGMMQPALQKRISPLAAALLVSLVWSLWHMPLYLNGFYSEPLVTGMIGGAIFRLFLAVFLAWVYNRSGSLLCMVILHTAFNMVVNFLPVSDLVLLVLWLIVTVGVVVKDKMYRRLKD